MTIISYTPSPINVGSSSAGAVNGTATPTAATHPIGLEAKTFYQQFVFTRYTAASPAGEFITGWNVNLTRVSIANGFSNNWSIAVGLLEPDGKWNISGYPTSVYPTWQTYPRPTLTNHVIIPGVLFGNAWLGTAAIAGQLDPAEIPKLIVGEYASGAPAGLISIPGSTAVIKTFRDIYPGTALGFVFTVFEDTQTYKEREIWAPVNGAPSFSLQLTLKTELLAPVITSTPPLFAVEDDLYSYQIVATDPQGDTLTYTRFGGIGASGLLVDSSTGLVTWTPVPGDVGGAHFVILRVSDGTNHDQQSFSIAVLGKFPVPVVVGSENCPQLEAGSGPSTQAVVDSKRAVGTGINSHRAAEIKIAGSEVVSIEVGMGPASDPDVENC